MIPEQRKRKYEDILRTNDKMFHTVCRMKQARTIEEQVSQYVLVPALTSFVFWLLDLAVKRKIKRLYFLSRDGYLMYTAARIICNEKKLPVECRYLFCSRFSLRVPLFHLDMEQALDYICARGTEVTPEKVLKRSGFLENEIPDIFLHVKIPFALDQTLSVADLCVLRRKLSNSPYFLKAVENNSKKHFPALCGYFKQEGLLDEIPIGIVDSGWIGSIQKTIVKGCTAFGKKCNIEGFYWGLYELPENVPKEQYHCYYFSPEDKLLAKTFFSNCLFETIFSAPHGMTVAYERKKRYQPVLTEYPAQRALFDEKLRYLLENYIHIFLENFAVENMGLEAENAKKTIERLLKIFMCNPTIEEAAYFGNFVFDEDVTDCHNKKLAYPLTRKELLSNHLWFQILFILKNKPLKESGWYEGSVVLHGKWTVFYRYCYFGTRFLRFFRKEIIYRMRKIGKP